jgi:hypothetical protein
MEQPQEVDPAALYMLQTAGWKWCPVPPAFLKARDLAQQTPDAARTLPQPCISYEWLTEQGLIGARVPLERRAMGLLALQRLLREGEHSPELAEW